MPEIEDVNEPKGTGTFEFMRVRSDGDYDFILSIDGEETVQRVIPADEKDFPYGRLDETHEAQMNRQMRNGLIAECDWTQIADNGISDADRAKWVTYRQELRDLPNHTKWPRIDEHNAWPTPPWSLEH